MMPQKPADEIGNERVFKKLGKSIIAYSDIRVGEELTLDKLSGRIFNTHYIPVRESNKVLGKTVKRDIA
ncbi:N-acylneuraminate-9-phosphate synthase, partial [Rhizobium ruizarguesonis]